VRWGDMECRSGAPGSVGYEAIAKAILTIPRGDEGTDWTWVEVSFSGYLSGEKGEWIGLPTSKAFTIEGLRLEDLEPLAVLFSALHEQLASDGLIEGGKAA
jgi:hypothetical protein